MTKPRDETSTKQYADLYADFSAQIDTLYDSSTATTPSEAELESIKEEFRKDKRYALLVKHKFQPPNGHTKRVAQSDLDKMVESHGL